MVNQTGCDFSLPEHVIQCLHGQRVSSHGVCSCPTRDRARAHDGNTPGIHDAFASTDIGEVADPSPVRTRGCELAFDQVRTMINTRVLPRRRQVLPSALAPHAGNPDEPTCLRTPSLDPGTSHSMPHLCRPIDTIVLAMNLTGQFDELTIAHLAN